MADTVNETNGDVKEKNGNTKTVAEPKNIKNGIEQVKTNGSQTSRKRKNQFGDDNDDYMTNETWRKRWKNKQTKFHMQKVHPTLEKHYDWLTDKKEQQRIFLPLCGKSLDLKWLADQGQVVIGNEYCPEGIEQFFEEHDMEYSKESIKDIKGYIYKAKGKNITIYCCDYFLLTPDVTGTFDCIWDRGALAAINPVDRVKYAKVMSPLLRKDGRYLLEFFEVDHETFIGPPYDLKPKLLENIYATHFKTEKAETRNSLTPFQKDCGISYFIVYVYYVTWPLEIREEIGDEKKCDDKE
ncbi:thiopurine S-methyltransferase-like [Glandiceps talaboti]